MAHLSRRSFLEKLGGGLGLAATASIVPSYLRSSINRFPSDEKKMNIALCGLGNYAGYLAEGLQSSRYCRLAGIVTAHPAKAQKWKQQYHLADKNIYNYQNFDEIANNKDIDVVYV